MKRFYQAVDVRQEDSGWVVTLDDRTVRTPAGKPAALPSEPAARLLAGEWEAQEAELRPHAMTLVRLVNVAIDRTPSARAEIAAQFVKYAETDAICHPADAPEGLRALQEAQWAPLRDWAAEALDVRLVPAPGMLAAPQPRESLDRLRALALALDDLRLTALAHAAAELGSAILALALLRRRLEAGAAFELSLLEARWRQAQWGADAEEDAREAQTRDALRALELLLAALP